MPSGCGFVDAREGPRSCGGLFGMWAGSLLRIERIQQSREGEWSSKIGLRGSSLARCASEGFTFYNG